MPKYRKKPVVIEAEVYQPGLEDGSRKVTGKSELINAWIRSGAKHETNWDYGPHRIDSYTLDVPYINTLEGKHYISPGDYIVTGIKGERYPVKPDIFEATYEPVEE